MAKLYFRFGTVSSAKTLNLLAVVHNYEQQKKRALLFKPKLDDRFGLENVKSRAGLYRQADLLIDHQTHLNFDMSILKNVDCIVVDEAQFLSLQFIEFLREITRLYHIPVICYGLKTDFKTKLFEGSKRLLELADSIEEVKTTCFLCNQKAVFNLKFVDQVAQFEGESIELGADEKYSPVCYKHYKEFQHCPGRKS